MGVKTLSAGNSLASLSPSTSTVDGSVIGGDSFKGGKQSAAGDQVKGPSSCPAHVLTRPLLRGDRSPCLLLADDQCGASGWNTQLFYFIFLCQN